MKTLGQYVALIKDKVASLISGRLNWLWLGVGLLILIGVGAWFVWLLQSRMKERARQRALRRVQTQIVKEQLGGADLSAQTSASSLPLDGIEDSAPEQAVQIERRRKRVKRWRK